jgi:predicted kinase
MKKSDLIIISGPSASGKTTIGQYLGRNLCWPFFSKDAIKETLFDLLGWKDRQRSLEYGAASYAILYYFVECQLKAGLSCLVESNFLPKIDRPKFLRLKKTYGCNLISIFCNASQEVLMERFKSRVETGQRHPGHVDSNNYDLIQKENTNKRTHFLDFGEGVIEIDTTDFDKVDFETILNQVKQKI